MFPSCQAEISLFPCVPILARRRTIKSPRRRISVSGGEDLQYSIRIHHDPVSSPGSFKRFVGDELPGYVSNHFVSPYAVKLTHSQAPSSLCTSEASESSSSSGVRIRWPPRAHMEQGKVMERCSVPVQYGSSFPVSSLLLTRSAALTRTLTSLYTTTPPELI